MSRTRRSRSRCSQVVKITVAVLLVVQIVALALSIQPNEEYIARLAQQNSTISESSKVWRLATYSADGLIASTALVILIVILFESYCLLLSLTVPFILFTLLLTVLTAVKTILYSKTLFIDVVAVVLSLTASVLVLFFAALIKKHSAFEESRNERPIKTKTEISAPLLQQNSAAAVQKPNENRSPSLPPKPALPADKRLPQLPSVRSDSAIELSQQRGSHLSLKAK